MASALPDVQERVIPDSVGALGPRNSMQFAEPVFAAPFQGGAALDSDDDIVEITIDLCNDLVVVDSVQAAMGTAVGDESPLARKLEESSSSSIWQDDLESLDPEFKNFKLEVEGAVEKGFSPIRRDDTKVNSLLDSSMDLKVDYVGLLSTKRRFHELSVDGSLPRSSFGACIGTKDEEFAEKLFDCLARWRNISRDTIIITELLEFWEKIPEGCLQIFFDMVKQEADGKIAEEDVKKIIMFIASTNKMTNIINRAEEYVHLIMEELDPSNLGYILVEDLEALLLQAPSQSMRQMLRQRLRPTEEPNPLRRWYRRAKNFLENNWRRVWVMLLWLFICAGLFTWKLVQYRRRYHVFQVMGYCVCIAKGGAETLKFNMALILLPVCRNTITRLRTSAAVGRVVPLDDNINFHNVVAVGIAVGAVLHVTPHLACGFPRLLHATDAGYAPLAQYFGTTRPDSYWWFIRGTEGWTGLVMLALMAVAFLLATAWFRRGRIQLPWRLRRLTGFNTFWYTHHGFVVVYALLIVHGHFLYLTKKWYEKSTWMYLAVPMALYACERLTRVLRSTMFPVKTMLKVAVYPGNVLMLQFPRPPGFRYKSGQYIFLNCPAISRFQWHPFCITSAPQDDYVSVHIRTLGDWTRDLKNVFSMMCCRPPMDGKSGLLRADGDATLLKPSFPKLLFDGPYGLTAQDYKQYDVVLLISLGIGAAGMISIIRDIMNNVKQRDDVESGDASNDDDDSASTSFRTRRAYFYWATRDQGSFDWFRDVMEEVVETDKKGIIELHNYCISLYGYGDTRSALIAVLQSLNYAKHGIDVISGTRVKTHFGRPDWCNIYKRIALNHRDQRVGVFYCGAPVLDKELRELAQDFSRKTTTKFEFHKEYF